VQRHYLQHIRLSFGGKNENSIVAYDIIFHITLKVYNTRGQLVRILVNSVQEAGNHHVVWGGDNASGSSVTSGIYFYKMESSAGVFTRKMLLLK
jgi:hypothetical protein